MVTDIHMLDFFSMFGAKKMRNSRSKSGKKCSAGKVAVKAHRSNSDRRVKGKMIKASCRKSPKKHRKSKSKKHMGAKKHHKRSHRKM